MNEQQILDKLFTMNQEKSKGTYRFDQIDMSFTLQAVSEGVIEKIRNRYGSDKVEPGERVHGFNRALIAEATVAINGDPNVTWKHPELLKHYKASSPEQVIKRVLLPGYVVELADKVMELSGYYDKAAKEVEEIKNLSGAED